jgi:hypothetical protein
MSINHLIVPDPHDDPNQSQARFEALGNLILDRRPQKISILGDFADFASLCTHDESSISALQRDLKDEIESAHVARSLIERPMMELNKVLAKKKKALYKPEKNDHEGNHEYRTKRFINKAVNSKLKNLIPSDLTGYEKFGWNHVPYEGDNPGVNVVDGIMIAHYLTSGSMGKPIGGQYGGAALCRKKHMSCIVGHDHRLNHYREGGINTIHGLVAGCYFDYYMNYAGQSNPEWWSGIHILHMTGYGQYDLESISIERVKELYL